MRRIGVRVTVILLIAINILVFIETLGNSTYIDNMYAMYAPSVKQGQYYRLITSCFLHAGIVHIVCNMSSLWNLGRSVERYVNAFELLLVYFAAGICGNLCTMYWDTYTGNYTMSLGASGAIFGLVGLLIALAITRSAPFSVGGLLLNTIYILIPGFLSRGISNTAHIGGLTGGFIVGLVLILCKGSKMPKYARR